MILCPAMKILINYIFTTLFYAVSFHMITFLNQILNKSFFNQSEKR